MKHLKKQPVAVKLSNPITRQGSKYQNIGYLIRMGLYDGVSDDASTLLRNQYDGEVGETDPMFKFGDPRVGVDKFERAVIASRKANATEVEPTSQEVETTSKSSVETTSTDVQ